MQEKTCSGGGNGGGFLLSSGRHVGLVGQDKSTRVNDLLIFDIMPFLYPMSDSLNIGLKQQDPPLM